MLVVRSMTLLRVGDEKKNSRPKDICKPADELPYSTGARASVCGTQYNLPGRKSEVTFLSDFASNRLRTSSSLSRQRLYLLNNVVPT